jgi:hypothetical protein
MYEDDLEPASFRVEGLLVFTQRMDLVVLIIGV